jgi:hypothetical protein
MLLTNIHIFIHVRLNFFQGVKSHGVYIHTTHALSRRGSKDISGISPRFLRYFILAMRNTADGTSGKPIAVSLQSISGGSATKP